MTKPRFDTIRELMSAFVLGDIDGDKCEIFFDGGECLISHEELGLLYEGSPATALADALGLKIGEA